MANQEHLEILAKGVKVWNEWRISYQTKRPELSEANLYSKNLTGADLSRTDLHGALLSYANLSGADLSGANLGGAYLTRAELIDADLGSADLHGADLRSADLRSADLSDANLEGAILGATVFGDIDLSSAHGLDRVSHLGPSTIAINTIYRSGGKIPEAFLRGAGVHENFITYMRSLTGAAFDFYSCFISYSTKDQPFADRLHADLQARGVRCWLASEDLKIGDRFRSRIDESIRGHDKLLIVLSKDSIGSRWVEKEVETAFERERRENKTVLFPIRLDDAVIHSTEAWAADIRRIRHIGDFTGWEQHARYVKRFERLVRDLKAKPDDKATAQPAP